MRIVASSAAQKDETWTSSGKTFPAATSIAASSSSTSRKPSANVYGRRRAAMTGGSRAFSTDTTRTTRNAAPVASSRTPGAIQAPSSTATTETSSAARRLPIPSEKRGGCPPSVACAASWVIGSSHPRPGRRASPEAGDAASVRAGGSPGRGDARAGAAAQAAGAPVRPSDRTTEQELPRVANDRRPARRSSAPAAGRAHRRRERGRRLRGVRHHRRPGEGHDLPLAVPAGAARAAELPDRRRRRRRLDRRRPARARARVRSRAPARRSTTRSSSASPRGSPTSRRLRRRRDLRARRATRSATPQPRSSTSRSRRSCSARVVKGLAGAGLTDDARVVVEKPFGHDLASARALNDEVHAAPRRVAAVPHRPLPREDGPARDPLPALRQHDARADLEPQLRRRRCRSRWPRTSASRTAATSTTRSARCATSWSTT